MSYTSQLSVYLRSPVSTETDGRQASVLGRAHALKQQGLIDDISVTHWNRLASESDRQEAGEIEAMEQWASNQSCSLAPTLDRHDRHSAYLGDDSVIALPLACLAYWEDDTLVAVYPHVGPSGHCTVADGLDRIEAALQSGAPLAQTGSQR